MKTPSIAPYTKAQYTKYAINAVSLILIFVVGYSIFVLYQNKHNHDESRPSIIGLITHRQSKITKLQNSPVAKQDTNVQAQYNTVAPPVAPSVIAQNAPRTVALNFFNDYLANKQSGQDQSATLAKYGTANLASQYTTASNDPLLCGATFTPTSVTIASQSTTDGKDYYNLDFSDAKGNGASSQAIVINSGGNYLIDAVACAGPI